MKIDLPDGFREENSYEDQECCFSDFCRNSNFFRPSDFFFFSFVYFSFPLCMYCMCNDHACQLVAFWAVLIEKKL